MSSDHASGASPATIEESILEPDLPVVDAHQHLFDQPTMRYRFEDYLADAGAGHHVVASVYVETLENARVDGPELLRPLGEVEFANGLAAMSASGRYGPCRVAAAIVGHADLSQGERVAELLDRCLTAAPDRFRGVRDIVVEHPDDAPFRYFVMDQRPIPGTLRSPQFAAGLRQLAPRGLTFDASIFHQQLPNLAAVADEHPDLTIVLNHMGVAVALDLTDDQRHAVFTDWRRGLIELARRPNVVCKVGGLGMPFWGLGFDTLTTPTQSTELAAAWRPYIEVAIEAFGVERCMMESNYPPDSRSARYVPLWNALKLTVSDASNDEKSQLFSHTASRTYRIGPPAATSGPR